MVAALLMMALVVAVVQTAVVGTVAAVLTFAAAPVGPGVMEKLTGVFRPREKPVLVVAAMADVVGAKVVAVVTGKAAPVGLKPNGADVEAAGTELVQVVNGKPVVKEEVEGSELTTEANRDDPAAGATLTAPVVKPAGFAPKEKL